MKLKQPLGAMSLNCETALECLNEAPPDLDEARSCLTDAMEASSCANKIVAGVRALFKFKTTARQRMMVDIHRLG